MKNNLFQSVLLIFTGLLTYTSAAQPYSGTIFIDSTIVTSSDPSTIVSTTYMGQGMRTVYDRRVSNWISINAYLFDITWSDGLTTEAQVNPEFGSQSAAFTEASKYGTIIGRLPHCLRVDVDALWIHMGTQPFGGGNKSILIHTGQSSIYESQGILEETLIHEASHTSLDVAHASAPGWIAAQNADVTFISSYAASNSVTEDIAESFLTWFAIRQCVIKISTLNYNKIAQAIPNRIGYFDAQDFNMFPLCINPTGTNEVVDKKSTSVYPNPFSSQTTLLTEHFLENATLTVYNCRGQKVQEQQNIYGKSFIFYRDKLVNGLYFIQLAEKNRILSTDKLVITD